MPDSIYRYTCKGRGAVREVRTLHELTAGQKRHILQSDCPFCQLKGIVKGGGKGNCHCKNCDYYDPWDHPKMGGYNDEYWGGSGEPISEEEQKKMLEFAEAFGKAAANTADKVMEKVLQKNAEKENKKKYIEIRPVCKFYDKRPFWRK